MHGRRFLLAVALTVVGTATAACVAPTPPPPTGDEVPVMGANDVPAGEIAAWYRASTPVQSPRASVSIDALADTFVTEGESEGVRGDIAFAQAVLETGWFGFSGSVPPTYNNFAGIGATDGGGTPAQFPDATTGVRAQVQHLRAYADKRATRCATPPLHHPCEDPRFDLVTPKGKAPTWNVMGSGNWATDPAYGSKVLALYNEMRAHAGLPAV